jgi:hypothetical protein
MLVDVRSCAPRPWSWPVPDRSRPHTTPRSSHEYRVRPQLFVFVTAVNRTAAKHPSSCELSMDHSCRLTSYQLVKLSTLTKLYELVLGAAVPPPCSSQDLHHCLQGTGMLCLLHTRNFRHYLFGSILHHGYEQCETGYVFMRSWRKIRS